MTIGASNRNDAVGNGSTETYAYGYKIFAATDLRVTVRDPDTDEETTLTYLTHYTVTNVGRAAGGNIVLVDGAFDWIDDDGFLDENWSISIRRVVDIVQETDVRNQGGFFADVHEDEFDYLTMIDQQQQDELDRAFKLPETVDPDTYEPTLPVPEDGTVLMWQEDEDDVFHLINVAAEDFITIAVSENKLVDLYIASSGHFTAGTTTSLTLSQIPGAEENVTITFDGVVQHHNTYSISDKTVTFSSAIPVGTLEVEAQYSRTLSVATAASENVTFVQTGTGAVTRSVRDWLRGFALHFDDFDVPTDETSDCSAAIQKAIDEASLSGKPLYAGPYTYICDAQIEGKNNVHLIGAGIGSTVLKLKSGSNFNVLNFGSRNHFSVRNLTIDGNKANVSGGSCLTIVTSTDFFLGDLEFKDFYGSGAIVQTNSARGTVRDIIGNGGNGHVLSLSEFTNGNVDNIIGLDCTFAVVNAASCSGLNIENVSGEKTSAVDNGYAVVRIAGGNNLTVANVTGNQWGRTLFILSGAVDITANNITSLDASAESVLISSTADGVTARVALSNITISNTGQLAPSGSVDAIRIDGANNVTVNGAIITDADANMEYGIRSTDNGFGNATNITVDNAQISGATTASESYSQPNTTKRDGAIHFEWTPVPTFATAGDVAVTGTPVGRGIKKGREVTLFFVINGTITHSTASGNFTITGNPYTADASSIINRGSLQWTGITKANYTHVMPGIASGGTSITLAASGSGQANASVATADIPTGGTLQLIGSISFITAQGA